MTRPARNHKARQATQCVRQTQIANISNTEGEAGRYTIQRCPNYTRHTSGLCYKHKKEN